MQLRNYQLAAVESVYAHLRERDDNPCVVLPTAAGKTPVIAAICGDVADRWKGRAVILAHVKELVEQSFEKLMVMAPGIPVGVYSAGLRRRDLEYAVTVASIQSIWKRAGELGPVDLVIVDEAHMIPGEDDGMYRSFLADAKLVNPAVRVVGLTATPFRLKSGEICGPPPDHILNHICLEVGVRELIAQRYLSPLRTKAGTQRPDYEQLHVRGGEFIPGEVENLMDDDALVQAACAEIVAEAADRKSILIFASGIKHAQHIVATFKEEHGLECGFVSGDTSGRERAETLARFRRGDLRLLANVNVLTVGFDAPNIDCVALMRPTMSAGLFYQMVGRGFRLSPETGKRDCLVLDFGGNVLRHGPVDDIRPRKSEDKCGVAPAKECPQCHVLIAAGYAACPECGHAFPPPEKERHEATATDVGILTGQVTRTEEAVSEVGYRVHFKRDDPDAPPTLRVEYRIGLNRWHREWICLEHPRNGFARRKAQRWWESRSNERVPETIEEAVDLANAGAIAPTLAIVVEHRAGEKFPRIVSHMLGERPPRLDGEDGLVEAVPTSAADDDIGEVPF